jgi:nucleoid DNA-binding protein
MNDLPGRRMRELPLKSCPVCGGDWFREADYYEFLREELLGYSWPTWPDLVGQASQEAKTLLVCLCGTPQSHVIGGETTPYPAKRRFMASSENGQECLKRRNDEGSLRAAAAEQLTSPEALHALAARLKGLERTIGRRMRSGRGRPWRLPTREPDAKGRDVLVLALEEKAGLTSRKAKQVVYAFWKVMEACIRRGEVVETPMGVFRVTYGPQPREQFGLGRQQLLYRRPRKIAFNPSPQLLEVCDETRPTEAVPKENSMPAVNVPNNQYCCEQCGSSYFVEGQFRRYRKMSSSLPGGDLSPVTEDPVRALVCICGHPINPGKLRRQSIAREDHASFQKSFAAAWVYRQSKHPQAIIGRLSQSFAGKEAYERLANQIANLEAILQARLPQSPQSPNASVPDTGS